MNEKTARLEEYGRVLVAAGFRAWVTPTTSGGYLTYERDGFWGHLQEFYFDGWAHDMPIVPSREYGSSMFIGRPVADVWSVEAAEQVARATNHNDVVGTRANAGDRTWLSTSSRAIHAEPAAGADRQPGRARGRGPLRLRVQVLGERPVRRLRPARGGGAVSRPTYPVRFTGAQLRVLHTLLSMIANDPTDWEPQFASRDWATLGRVGDKITEGWAWACQVESLRPAANGDGNDNSDDVQARRDEAGEPGRE